MLDYVRKQEWMPRGFYKQLGIIESACEDMKLELGRTPTVDELAKHLGIEKKTLPEDHFHEKQGKYPVS